MQGRKNVRTARRDLTLAAAAALCAACSGGPPLLADPAAKFELPPLQTSVPEYELLISPEALAKFDADVHTDDQPATFVHQGHQQPVSVRLRGNSSRYWPKKSWRIDFPQGVHFDHRKKLNLISEWKDNSMMVDKLGYDLLAALHVPVPRASYARLKINGRYEGVFVDVEHVGSSFVKAHGFADMDATRYRCGRKDCEMKTWRASFQTPWDHKEGYEDEGPLNDLMGFMNNSAEAEFARSLEDRFEVEIFLRDMVVDALISNNIIEDSRSYFIHDRRMGRWVYIPWDLNNSDLRWQPWQSLDRVAQFQHPIFAFTALDSFVAAKYARRIADHPEMNYLPIFSNLRTRIAFNPALRDRFLALVERALAEVFTAETLVPRLEATEKLLAPYMAADPYMQFDKFESMPHHLLEYMANRSAFLHDEVARWRSWRPGLVIEAFNLQQGWVELRNRGPASVSTQGLVLTTDLRRALTRNVPAATLGTGERVRFTGAQLGLTFAPQGELGLFDGQSVAGAIDVHFYGKLAAGRYEARSEGGDWEIR
jgi:spore coat protein H